MLATPNVIITLTVMYIAILLGHFIMDFVLQSDKMALNKSSSNKQLAIHCVIYSSIFIIINWKWGLINGLTHFIIDWVTSRLTTKYYNEKNRHMFFITIGFDQFLHVSILFVTYIYLVLGVRF